MTRKAKVLLDTSVVLEIALMEPGWEEAAALIEQREPYVADTVDIEVGNALSKHYRRGLLSANEVRDIWANFHALQAVFQRVPVNVGAALEIVTARRMWAYDAYVVEAARERGLPLLTRDNQQASIAALHGVKIL